MKIISFALIFVVLFLPFFQIIEMHLDSQEEAKQLAYRYNTAMRTAVQDAASVLNDTSDQDKEPGYGSNKFFAADKERAVDTFYRTLALNFDAQDDPIALGALSGYIPAIAVIDYDGYFIYSMEEYVDKTGQVQLKAVWSPKKTYAHSDSAGNLVQFTLDSFVRVYDRRSSAWVQGFQKEVGPTLNIPLLKEAGTFENVRRRTIINAIQDDLASTINRHNQYAARYGIHYVFTLPQISQEEWNNGIDDIGVVAFLQGIPVGDQAYNNYSFGGGRLVRKKAVYGSIDPISGIRYYSRHLEELPGKVEETFDGEKDAARSGYFPIQ
ncbi:hypothetical protein B9G55_04665 [Saccharibacillus sp. O16]|nr:hypothetical protein B9G55_04665 [Saccharibacillus sp. O16]